MADIALRGSSAKELKESRWFVGPKFLWTYQVPIFETSSFTITETDPEVKKVNSLATTASRNFELERFEHCSSCQRLKKAVALCLLFKKWLKSKVSKQPFSRSRMVTRQRKQSLYVSVSSTDMQETESEILKQVQSNVFSREFSHLREGAVISSGPLFKLDCFIDGNGLILVGGRLFKAKMSSSIKNPVVLPKSSHVTQLLVSHCHQGRGMALNETRSRGFWIIGGSSVVSGYIHSCVLCRQVRAAVGSQQMSDLPSDRVSTKPTIYLLRGRLLRAICYQGKP